MFRNPLVDVLVVVLVALLIFGPKRLPMLGRSLGQGLREFKESITGESKGEDAEERPALNAASPGAAPPAAASGAPATAAPGAPAADGPAPDSAEVGSAERRP